MRLLSRAPRVSLLPGMLLAWLLLSAIPVNGAAANARHAGSPALTLTVTNVGEAFNGDLSSPAALLASPGADGISLPEALIATQADTGAHETINFAPALAGAVIALSQTLPEITRSGLTLDGDSDDDGAPDVTIDGGGAVSEGLLIRGASDVLVEGLHLRNFSGPGIEIATHPREDGDLVENLVLRHNILENIGYSPIVLRNDRRHALIRNVEIAENTLQNYRVGITLNAASAVGASDNQILNVSIRSNTLIATSYSIGIFIAATGAEDASRNTIRDIRITGNRIRGHANSSILVDAGNQANCNDNLTSDILIAENQVDGAAVDIEMVTESGANSTGNRLTGVTIADNTLTGGGIMFAGATGRDAHDNTASDVLIERNRISACSSNGVYLAAGSGGAHDNLLEDVLLRNNLIADCTRGAGVLLHGEDAGSPRNAIRRVAIANLTLVNNGGESGWAGGIHVNSLDASNTIEAVSVTSTILWQNGGGDAILGSLAPASVSHSRLNDERFTDQNGNFRLIPGFVDPAAGDYHLRSDSACIESGDPSAAEAGELDLEKNPRRWDADGDGAAVVDRGAYEFNAALPLEVVAQRKSQASPSAALLICLAVGLSVILAFWLGRKKR